jgi:hypothetical protein
MGDPVCAARCRVGSRGGAVPDRSCGDGRNRIHLQADTVSLFHGTQKSKNSTEMKRVALTLRACGTRHLSLPKLTHGSGSISWVTFRARSRLPCISQEPVAEKSFTVYDALTDKPVFRGAAEMYDGAVWGMAAAARLDFSGLTTPGGYYIIYRIKVGDISSRGRRI